jgi:pimeloyl-ACP methyl ester carboxylesterase
VARFPRPGRLFDAGGFRLHLNVAGQRRPVVVFDAALGASSLSWTLVQAEVATLARTCVYDRAGFGWSERGPLPRTAGRAAGELRLALASAGEPPPYLLVGHSYGGLVARIFAGRYAADVAGLVLVDPAHPEDWLHPAAKEQARIDRGVQLCRHGLIASRVGLARVVSGLVGVGAISAARRIVNVVTGSRFESELSWILAPFFKLPASVRRPVRHFWTQPKFFEALGSQIASISESAREVLDAAPRGYGDLPLVAITRADYDDHTLHRHADVARLSSRGQHIVASRGGHWLPLDEPGVVVDVIREMHAVLSAGRRSSGDDARVSTIGAPECYAACR